MASEKLVQHVRVRTNTTKDSVCSIKVDPVSFSKLWESYPSGQPYTDPRTGKPPASYENQCAIRVSMAIHGVGVEMKSFSGGIVMVNGLKTAVLAVQLAGWLNLQPFCGLPQKPENITGKDWESKIKGRTGIIYFENYWRRRGENKKLTGDHIDLWNGSNLTPNVVNNVRRLGLTSVQWLPWPLSGFNFSDLGKSTKILFWEVK